MPARARGVALALAAAAQLWLVGAAPLALAAGAAVLLVHRSLSARPLAGLALTAACAGGLGMALGASIEAAGSPHAHHPVHAASPLPLWGWPTGLMLLFCLPGCGRACASLRSAPARAAGTAATLLGMGAGMAAAAAAVQGAGAGPAAAHAAMVAGMAAGSVSAAALLRFASGGLSLETT